MIKNKFTFIFKDKSDKHFFLFFSGTQNRGTAVQNHIISRPTDDARNVQDDILSSDSTTLDNYDNKAKTSNNSVSATF